MADIERIRRLHETLVRECQRHSLPEALSAIATTTAAALSTAERGDRDKILQAHVATILSSLKQIDMRADPLAVGQVLN